MDSLTQIVLGAAIGEACLGKKVGNKAPLWGAIAGTIPDLDIVSSFFQGDLQYLISHRSLTHSLIFCVLMAPILGWVIHKLYKGRWGSWKDWANLSFWSFLTHTLLDCCTTWGTQLFYPFSDYRVALNNIFVADPLYTVPFLICVLTILFIHRDNKWRSRINWLGIGISSCYLLLTFVNKATVDAVFKQALHQQGKSIYRYSSYPTPLNNVLWYVVAEGPYDYELGYYSLMSDSEKVQFISIPKNHQAIEDAKDNYIIDRLLWLSKGYFTLTNEEGKLKWHDLRFGLMNGWEDDGKKPQYVFSFNLLKEKGVVVGISSDDTPKLEDFKKEDFQVFWNKILGKKGDR